MKTKLLTTTIALILGMGIQQNAHADLKDGLVAHWSFDDCRATDNSGNGHDGTLNGNPQCVDGVKGKAFSFDGSGNFVQVNDESMAFATENLTISVWINPSNSQTDFAGIIDKSHAASGNSGWVLQKSPIGDGLSFYFAYCTAEPNCSSWATGDGSERLTVNAKSWNHLVITKQGSDVNYYLDDKFISKQTYNFSEYTKTASPLLIGAVNGQNRYFNGSIDDLRIYNRALTEAEVLELYQGKDESQQPPSSGNESIYSLFQPLDDIYDALKNDYKMAGTVLGQCVYGGYCARGSNSSAHNGVDYMVAKGTPVYAVCDGVVKNVVKGGNILNRFTVIDHSGCGEFTNLFAYYGHIDPNASLKVGAKIEAGDQIGTVADWKTNSHLHLSLGKNYVTKGWGYTVGTKNTKKDCTKESVTTRRTLLDAKGWLDPIVVGSESGWNPALLKGGAKGCVATEQPYIPAPNGKTLPYLPWK